MATNSSLPWGRPAACAGACTLACLTLLGVGACRSKGTDPAAKSEQAREPSRDARAARTFRPSPESLRDAEVEVAPVTVAVGALEPVLALPGEVVAIPDRSARLSTPVAGRVQEVRFNEGSVVTKGETLAVVRVPDLGKVRGAFAATTARARAAHLAADRLARLRAMGLTPEQEVQDARAQAEALDADAKALGEQLSALGMGGATGNAFDSVLPAPVSGVVTKRDVVVGQPVTAEQNLAELSDLREVWFLARAYEKDLGRLRLGASAEVALNAYPAQVFPGTVSFIGAQVDPVSRTLTARIKLTGRADALRIGLFGTANVSAAAAGGERDEPRRATVIVPRAALTEVEGKPVVFVEAKAGEFEMRSVSVGASAGSKVGVDEGLKEGERVAVKGVFSLKSMALRASLEEP